jgi:hypothetical protein
MSDEKGFSVSIKWEGFDEFEKLLDQINEDFGSKDAQNILRNACRASMVPVLNAARSHLQSNGNVDTGQLLASLQVEARKPTARDKRSIYSTPTMIMISRVTVAPGRKFLPDQSGKSRLFTKTFKSKKTGEKQHMHSDARAFAIEFGTAKWNKGEGMPFIRPALEGNSVSVTNNLGQMLGTALTKYKSKVMKVK